MALAEQVLLRVTEGIQEVLVGSQDLGIQVELDHRHGAVYRLQAACVVRFLAALGGDVGGELDDLRHASGTVQNRGIGGLQPDLLPGAVHPRKLPAVMLTLAQTLPERGIGRRITVLLRQELAMVLALQLGPRVAHQGQELGIGRQHRAIQGELDDRLRAGHRGPLGGTWAQPAGQARKQGRGISHGSLSIGRRAVGASYPIGARPPGFSPKWPQAVET